MAPNVLMHLAAAVGAAAIAIVALARGTRSAVLIGIFITAISIALWNTSNALSVMTGELFWRILSPGLGALPFGVFASLSLRAGLGPSRRRRAFELIAVGLALSLSLATLSAFFLPPVREFVLSPGWNVAFLGVAAPCIGICVFALLAGIRWGSARQRQFSVALLLAGAVGFAGGLTEVLPLHAPLQLGAAGTLVAVIIGAVGVTTRDHPEESIALKEILVSLGVAAGILVGASQVVSRTQGRPYLAVAILGGIGIVAFGVYRLTLMRWQRRLQEAARLAALGRATSILAHEVRNPLTTVQGAIDILEHELSGPDAPQSVPGYLATVRSELRRVLDLVEDCLAFARAPAPAEERFDLHRLLGRVVDAARLRFPAARIDCTLSDAPVDIVGDASQLGRLVENLVVNACQTSDAPCVSIAVIAVSDRWVGVAVGDDGPGVSPENRRKIFEPFFTTKASGGGLGLAIVREIARRHGGDIDVEPVEPHGARFVARWQRRPEVS